MKTERCLGLSRIRNQRTEVEGPASPLTRGKFVTDRPDGHSNAHPASLSCWGISHVGSEDSAIHKLKLEQLGS